MEVDLGFFTWIVTAVSKKWGWVIPVARLQ
jgi:hypothetical protein